MIENILSIVMMSILLVWVATDIILKKKEKRAFMVCCILIICVVLAEMCCSMYDNTIPSNRTKSLLGNVIGFSLSPFIFIIESYIYNNKHIYIRFILGIVNLLIIVLSSYTSWIFCVDENNIYSRGPLYGIFVALFVLSILFSLSAKIKAVYFLPGYFDFRIILSSVVMLSGMAFQLIFPKYHSIWIIISVFFILDYAILCEINSMVDGLTGLLNKTVFNKQINLISTIKCSNNYILMLDVNDFKKINDVEGHLYGDKCLCKIASELKSVFKKQSRIFRFGGDEFCVLLKAESDLVVETKIELLKNNFLSYKDSENKFPDIAVGYAKFQVDLSPSEIIDIADSNMYARKKEMKNLN